MATIKDCEGTLTWKPAETKKGKQYLKVRVGDVWLYAFDDCDKILKFGDKHVRCLYKEQGKYKHIIKVEENGKPATQEVVKSSEKAQSEKPVPCYGHNPANCPQYLACKLAVELVQGEQIAVDKKLERFEAAYKVMLSKIMEGK